MPASTVTRWNLVVTKETDQSLRQYLAETGGGRKGDLSRFVEEAVRAQLWHLTVKRIKAQNQDRDPKEIEALANEAVDWGRRR
jgi:NAD-specific glutamate dehydrogenase